MNPRRSERGAAAVEFALVLPLLVTLLLGIMEFGRVYNAQVSVTSAAREGARVMAIQKDPVTAREAVRAGSPSLSPQVSDSQIAFSPATGCPVGSVVKVTVSYPQSFMTGFFGDGLTLTGKGAMRCGG